MIFKAV